MRNPFAPQILEIVKSKYSGEIKVIRSFGDTYISTGYLTQSGGLVKDVWKPVLKTLHSQLSTFNSVLILGLAGGTVARMLNKAFPGAQITGVEIDPTMIALGKKYLGLDNIPNLKIVIADAKSYLISHNSYFDLILVDLYLGDLLPEFVYSPEFIDKILKLGRIVVINHLFYDNAKKTTAGKLVKYLESRGTLVKLIRVLTNLMVICSLERV